MNRWLVAASIILLLAVGGFFTFKQWGLQQNGRLVPTYAPTGWTINDSSAPVSQSTRSPDFAVAGSAEPDPNCMASSEGCAHTEPGVVKGAAFNIQDAKQCLGPDETMERMRERWGNVPNLVEQKDIRVAGRESILTHWKLSSNSVTTELYNIVVLNGRDCHYIGAVFVKSPGTDYESEFMKYLQGIRLEAMGR